MLLYNLTRGPLVVYRSPACTGYAEQAWKYITICCINYRPCRSIRKQVWPYHKNGQGQPSVIIWTNLIVLEYRMLHIKFQCHQSLGSAEGDFLVVTRNVWNKIHPNTPWGLHMKFGFKRPSTFFRKKTFKMLNLSELGRRSMNALELRLS